ncbi:ABC transporter ATP-binding protein [Oceanibacterium hippocampi]|uniref:High-affinity branched-chain amino acid transport ATP-binding protein LivF n=1 Tax=Oceanibacterium hippocampi TaxID=745714 RepID=A0A1Y5TWC2_9PROT|nr:ABC transporter ATP-binding protein [Oceanibacterium hippocampi]SLN71461.1 High-affinity branched-chain amino acid transport ATP-binding protein LivF [Oceanibacterium hippocampi]
MLEVRDLRAGYGAVEVLHGVDLDVGDDEIVAILGSNGAGKSTLNNTISGLFPPFGGAIRFDGEDICGAPSERIVERGVIQVPEGRRVFPNMTVRDNLLLGGYRRGRANRKRNLDGVVAVFPRLGERFTQHAGTLSGGEQQMLAIGRAMMAEPRLLILDEPSLGLSPLLVEEMFGLIRRLHEEGLSILLVEQNVMESLALANRAYVIENGLITLSGPADELLDNPDLKRSYLGL